MMPNKSLWAISPLDGRYFTKTQELRKYVSEAALISSRVKVEIKYLIKLSKSKIIRAFSKNEYKLLKKLEKLSEKDLKQVKKIENSTHHDIKAVEYFIRERLAQTSLKDISSYIHFGITSEDINNIAYRLMFRYALNKILIPNLKQVLKKLSDLAKENIGVIMLARTHGQPAIPTTLGKEFSVFTERLLLTTKKLVNFKFYGKLNGAVGGYHALTYTYPKTNWLVFAKEFVNSFELKFNINTTQINPSDDLVELFSILMHINNILLDLNQDIWRYISDDWLVQTGKKKYIGSSTMPQKINPIEFENSEGNIILANSLFESFIQKLPISRLQRDLSSSTVMRNIGTAFAYTLLAYKSLIKGLDHIVPNKINIKKGLNKNWNILAEAMQTIARKKGDKRAYEKTAFFSKKQVLSQKDWQNISKTISLKLGLLTPEKYIGLSKQLTQNTVKKINSFLNGEN